MKRVILLVAIVQLLLNAGCQQMHWQRSKVRVRGNNKEKIHSVVVVIENKKPYLFESGFNERLKLTCEKEFVRQGYTLKYKDKPDFIATIKIDMDSFATKGYYVYGEGGLSSFWRAYKRDKVYAILFDYSVMNTKFSTPKWIERNDIFYFGVAARDTRRSINMVKYTIRYGS